MTFARWVGPILLAALAVPGCADQEADETGMETTETMETDAPAVEAPVGDTSSADLAVWNTDPDARLSSEEFGTWLEEQDFFGQWNVDGAPGLTVQELGAGLAGVLDANDDGAVSSAEWADASTRWTAEGTTFADWDADSDGALDAAETAAGLEAGSLWNEWDRDGSGTLDAEEFGRAVFDAWDTNEDGYVDQTEWRASFDLWS